VQIERTKTKPQKTFAVVHHGVESGLLKLDIMPQSKVRSDMPAPEL
jgi:hypothetical protein